VFPGTKRELQFFNIMASPNPKSFSYNLNPPSMPYKQDRVFKIINGRVYTYNLGPGNKLFPGTKKSFPGTTRKH
jgi:hypothetical protein